jgi:outer membrane protein OmpA-like peptidoglycan-associated protein
MATNLLDISKGHFTDIAIGKAANLLGENNAATYKAVNFILPAFLGGMANKAASSEGANELMQHFKDSSKIDMSGPLGTLMGGGTSTNALMSAGTDMVNSIFGKRTGHIADWVATNTKIKIASASSLMNMVAPILMNLISKRSSATGTSVLGLLNEQMPILRNANLPEGLIKVANLDLTAAITTKVDEEAAEPVDFTKFIPWIIGAAVVLGGLFFFKTCMSESDSPKPVAEKPAATTATAPAPVAAAQPRVDSVPRLTLPEGVFDIPKGSFLDKLYTEITDPKADLTKPLTLDSVYFKNASARLTPESRAQVDELVKILKAYPTVEIKIEGHTDNFGIPEKNLRLSNIRAASVKRYLTMNGIVPERITTEGFGDAKPIADNATPEGMAKNRRIEVYVTKK